MALVDTQARPQDVRRVDLSASEVGLCCVAEQHAHVERLQPMSRDCGQSNTRKKCVKRSRYHYHDGMEAASHVGHHSRHNFIWSRRQVRMNLDSVAEHFRTIAVRQR